MPEEESAKGEKGLVSGADGGEGEKPGREDMSDPSERAGRNVLLSTKELDLRKETRVSPVHQQQQRSNNNNGVCRLREQPGRRARG